MNAGGRRASGGQVIQGHCPPPSVRLRSRRRGDGEREGESAGFLSVEILPGRERIRREEAGGKGRAGSARTNERSGVKEGDKSGEEEKIARKGNKC